MNLSIPHQHNYTDPTVERDVVRLQHWLTNLPLMDVVETVRLVSSALQALNEQKLDAAQRFRCLEVYRATAQRLFVTVDPLHLRQLSLSKSQRTRAIDGVEHLLASIAGGYKLIVTDVCKAGAGGSPHALLGPAINRALEQLGFSLLDGYRFYREIQPWLVGESHQLYRLARQNGLLDCFVEDTEDVEEGEPAASIAAIYHASMLLSITDPFRLSEGEVGLLFDVLLRHAGVCRIIPGSDWSDTGEGFFLIDLNGEGLPVSCAGLTEPARIKEPYLLDATALLDAVRERVTKTPEKVRMQSPEAMVLRRLLPEMAGAEQRREQRFPDSRWINLLLGVEGIHASLVRSAQKGSAPGSRQPVVDALACRVLNSSDSGMKLVWEGGAAGDARVGDLLGIVETSGGHESLRLAIIRNIRVNRKGGMEVGVQMLPGGLGAVNCYAPDQSGEESVRALFMPASEEEEFTATLVTSKGFYIKGRQLRIDVGGREVRARAGRLVFESPVFDRFEFSAE